MRIQRAPAPGSRNRRCKLLIIKVLGEEGTLDASWLLLGRGSVKEPAAAIMVDCMLTAQSLDAEVRFDSTQVQN